MVLKLNMMPFNANKGNYISIIHFSHLRTFKLIFNVFSFKYRKTYTGVSAFSLYMRLQEQGILFTANGYTPSFFHYKAKNGPLSVY